MSGTATPQSSVIPAQLSFLAIYNPSLGNTEETVGDQIVFYSSAATRSRRPQRSSDEDDLKQFQEEENEKLRQIGLAQGIVDFAKNFSNGKPVDSIETEKSRVVLHELEVGWWIVASIDLTRLPAHQSKPQQDSQSPLAIEYSAREVSPPELILQQLLRAHQIFLLHHAETLSNLWVRMTRDKFCSILDRFWTRFIWNWDILLHGNPSTDVFSGLKLAAGGELGIGVGEEEWGSGEREVLEGFVTRTDGLIDLVVSRFGDEPPKDEQLKDSNKKSKEANAQNSGQQWAGMDAFPRPGDGVIFSGVSAISRTSLRDISRWMEWIYKYGQDTYGVREHPSSTHRRKRRKVKPDTLDGKSKTSRSRPKTLKTDSSRSRDRSPGIPPPIVSAAEESLERAAKAASSRNSSRSRSQSPVKSDGEESSMFGTDAMMKYLTLGYGTSWNLGLRVKPSHRRVSALKQRPQGQVSSDSEEGEQKDMQTIDPTPEMSEAEEEKVVQKPEFTIGRYIIGLRGDLENDTIDEGDNTRTSNDQFEEFGNLNNRTMLRTLMVEMSNTSLPDQRVSDTEGISARASFSSYSQSPPGSLSSNRSRYKKLQVVVYLHQPFIFTFLFELRTPNLSLPSFYRSIHHQLGPLQKPLLSSTSPARVQERIFSSIHARTTSSYPNLPIYDLVYDPQNLTIHTTIPNIPELGTLTAESLVGGTAWTRIEALNVHTQILCTYSSTRSRLSVEVERTCKTSRGWWIVWMRLPLSNVDDKDQDSDFREAFLVRRASDYVFSSSFGKKSGGGSKWLRDISGSSAGSAAGGTTASPGKVAEGIGIDARRYVQGLLSLNR